MKINLRKRIIGGVYTHSGGGIDFVILVEISGPYETDLGCVVLKFEKCGWSVRLRKMQVPKEMAGSRPLSTQRIGPGGREKRRPGVEISRMLHRKIVVLLRSFSGEY
ncbi:hypothetical protein L6164_023283 [Bauhinia variegata]|uniref:Uncharacterized protein n=1 Tax=Bauhinia variegata TaxID=167791 RepID=A0ACB9MHQ5_BAUVA|nr:hypothetical protein L6164_023283 [Bauhinia variegata]